MSALNATKPITLLPVLEFLIIVATGVEDLLAMLGNVLVALGPFFSREP